MPLDPEEHAELLERRLTEKVTTSVETTLKRRYAWITAVVLGVYGIGGWAITRDMVQKEISTQVSTIMTKQVEPVQLKASEVQVTAEVARKEINLLQKRATDAIEEVEKLTERTLHTSRQLENQLKTSNEQIGSLGARLRTAEDVARQFEQVQPDIKALRQTVADLTKATQQVAQQTNVQIPPVSTLSAPAAATSPSRTGTKKIIYFQYSGTLSTEQAQQVAEELKKKLQDSDYTIPGIEQASSTTREVRFFYADDEKEADQLASTTNEILKRTGLAPSDVRSRDLTSWPRAKPPQGTLELWLHGTVAK